MDMRWFWTAIGLVIIVINWLNWPASFVTAIDQLRWLREHRMMLPTLAFAIIVWANWPGINQQLFHRSKAPTYDWSMEDLLSYLVYESNAGETIPPAGDHPDYGPLAASVRQAARDGSLTVWAKRRRGVDPPYEVVPPIFFSDNTFAELPVLMHKFAVGRNWVRESFLAADDSTDFSKAYFEPRFSSSQARAIWKRSKKRHEALSPGA